MILSAPCGYKKRREKKSRLQGEKASGNMVSAVKPNVTPKK